MVKTKYFGRCWPALGAVATLLIGPNAFAQQSGTYSGTTGDGNPISISVGVDGSTGNFEVTGVAIDFTLTCKKSQEQFGSDWGIGFASGADIINGKFSYALTYTGDYLPMKFKFQGTTSVKGKIGLTEPSFNPAFNYTLPPKAMQECASDQPFTATFDGADIVTKLAPGTVTIRRSNSTTTAALHGNN